MCEDVLREVDLTWGCCVGCCVGCCWVLVFGFWLLVVGGCVARLEERVARAHHRLARGRGEQQLDQRDPVWVGPPVAQVGGAAAAVRLGLVNAAAEGGRLVLATLQGAHLQHVGLQPGCTGLRQGCMGLRPRPRSAAGAAPCAPVRPPTRCTHYNYTYCEHRVLGCLCQEEPPIKDEQRRSLSRAALAALAALAAAVVVAAPLQSLLHGVPPLW